MKKIIPLIFITLFLAMGLTLSLGICMFGPSSAGANERLSEAPALFSKDRTFNDRFLYDVSAWINDHFFLRQEMISLNNSLNASLFQISEKDSVILGHDGWLYYGSTLNDYTGLDPMSDRELFAAARNLELMAEYCRNNGKSFAFMIAPNKNSLYPQNMPNFGTNSLYHDANILLAMLKMKDVQTIDLFEAFASEKDILYFATDSHWNSKGAALGADLINQAFGKESTYYNGPFTESTDYTGDLYEMLYPAYTGHDTQYHYQGELDFSFSGKATQPDSITLLTESNKSDSLLVYRDSFGNLLYPYLADSYGAVRFSRSTSYDLTLDADHVLIELVERNLRYLISYVPVMPSPVRQLSIPDHPEETTPLIQKPKATAPDGLTMWTGQLQTDAGDHIYILCDNTVYEAFLTVDGFAVYLPQDATPTDVIVGNDLNTIRHTVN